MSWGWWVLSVRSLTKVLAKLGYSPLWLEYGLINEYALQKQSQQYDTSSDKNDEHYRYAAFRDFLAKRADLADTLLDKYIQLAQLDRDRTMAQSALILLIEWPHLTIFQLDYLRKHPAFTAPVVKRRIERTQLLRQLQSLSLTEELFRRCFISPDETIQRELLKRQDISRQQIELLQEQGANRAVRNIAKQLLEGRFS